MRLSLMRFSRPALTALLMAAACLCAEAARLVDAGTKAALPLASITDRTGNVVGTTDRNGVIPPIPADRYPVTFSYLGYEPLEVAAPAGSDVEMTQRHYELPDIVVSPGSRPLLYITGYMREVASVLGSADSVTVLKESVVDFMIPVGKTKVKGWKMPRELASRVYSRMTNSEGLDSVSGKLEHKGILWGSYIKFLTHPEKMPFSKRLAGSHAADTVMGKNGPKYIWEKNGDAVRCSFDPLSDYKNHTFSMWALKLFGLTCEVSDMSFGYMFHTDGDNGPEPSDLSQISLSVNLLGKGKMFKRAYNSSVPVNIRSYIEVYVTGRRYLSDEDAVNIKKEPPAVRLSEVAAPGNAPELHPAVRQIAERVKALGERDTPDGGGNKTPK